MRVFNSQLDLSFANHLLHDNLALPTVYSVLKERIHFFLEIRLEYLNNFYVLKKSPLLARGLPVVRMSHCACLSHLALSSSLLAHCLLFPAWPCPSPTITSRSRRHLTLARMIAVDSRRRRYPVKMLNSLLASMVPFLRPRERIRDSAMQSRSLFTPSETYNIYNDVI